MENSAELRRDLKALHLEHRGSLPGLRELVKRLTDPSARAETRPARHDVILSGVNRRRFLKIGGVSVLSAAVLAACGNDDDNAAPPTPTSSPSSKSQGDITILRTASSLEHVAIDVYERALTGGLVTTPAVLAAAKLIQEQHRDHAQLFEGATMEAGGEAFTTANPAVLESLAGRIAALRSETDVLVLARDLEGVATATYQSSVGAFDNPRLNQATMSVGGVEARHEALLNHMLGQNANAVGFYTKDKAVAAGTGVG